MAHLRAVPDPDDPGDEPVDPAAAVAPGEDETAATRDVLSDDEEQRRYPSTIGGAFYLSILAAAGTGVVIAARGDWRLGIQVLGGSLIVAALLRLVLANRDAGMLAVRNRFVDATLLGATGASLIALANAINNISAT